MFCTDINATMINHGIEKIDNITKKQVLKSINKIILEKEGMYLVNKFKNDYLSKVENFTLLFNVMNKEGGGKANYKDIKTLSLGQKVVAMLSFVFGYTDYIKDYRPLIIDQPEDNLDNQYIYKNLVDDLRRIKGKRQVIIATHNATIVTNAKAEEVIVMESDGCHSWVAARGYPTQKGIKRHIINYMEGGIESFKHKISIYHEVLYN